VYSLAEIQAATEAARRLGLRVHMDGARFANAVAGLGVSPKQLTWQAGVEVLSFGSTKNGIPFGEAVVFLDRALAQDFEYRCKQGGHLASKMRFLAAPWVGILQDGAWLRHAAHANAMAGRLGAALRDLPGIRIAYPVESNAVFAFIPDALIPPMRARGWKFYTDVGHRGEARLMCSWDTTIEDVDAFAQDLAELAGQGPASRSQLPKRQ
jgi:threonine aldolase